MGVDIDAPSTHDLLRFGANFMPLSMVGEPWRLLSSGFFTYWYITSVIQQLCDVLFWTSYRDYHQLRSCWFVIYFGCGRRQLAWKLFGMAGCVLGTPLAISAGASGGIMGLGAFLFSLALLQAPIALKLNTKTLGFVDGD